jgi:hypothetical protein
MIEQSITDVKKLRTSFNEACDNAAKKIKGNEADQVIRLLSKMTDDLQQAGVDIRTSIGSGASEDAYEMVFTHSPEERGQLDIAAEGLFHVHHHKLLFALCASRDPNDKFLKLFVSTLNYDRQGVEGIFKAGDIHAVIQSRSYDFLADPAALQKLQEKLIATAATNKAIHDQDTTGSFNKSDTRTHKMRKIP